MFEIEITSHNAALRMTKAEFKKGFLSYPEADEAYPFLKKNCPDCQEINFDGHFGPYIYFTAEVEKYEKAKAQMMKAVTEWLAQEKAR